MAEIGAAAFATIPVWGIVAFMWFSNFGPGGRA